MYFTKQLPTTLDELRQMSRKLSEMNTAKCEALATLDEIRSGEVNKEVRSEICLCIVFF